MATNLATKTPGGTDEAFKWLLHSSGVGLSTGYQVGQGDGNDTMLYLDLDGIGVKTPGGSISKIRTVATVPRIVTFPDKAGTVAMLDDVPSTTGLLVTRPLGYSVPGTDTVDNTNWVPLTGGTLALPINKMCAVDMHLLVTKVAGALAPVLSLTLDSARKTDYSLRATIQTNASGTTWANEAVSARLTTASNVAPLVAATALNTAAGSYIIRITGWIKIQSTETGTPTCYVAYRRPASGTSVNFNVAGTVRFTLFP